MLNIFADALVIATRLGRVSDRDRYSQDEGRRGFQDDRGLRTVDLLRSVVIDRVLPGMVDARPGHNTPSGGATNAPSTNGPRALSDHADPRVPPVRSGCVRRRSPI